MPLQCVLVRMMKVKRAFLLLVHMRFLFLLSPPLDTCVIIYLTCRSSQTLHLHVFSTQIDRPWEQFLFQQTSCDAGFSLTEQISGQWYLTCDKAPAHPTLLASFHEIGLESNSTGSSSSADYPKLAPLAGISFIHSCASLIG